MKLLKLLFLSAILLSACNNDSTDTPETGEPKQIIVEKSRLNRINNIQSQRLNSKV